MTDKVLLCVHDEGKEVIVWRSPPDIPPERLGLDIVQRAKVDGVHLTVVVVPISTPSPDDVDEFLEKCIGEQVVEFPNPQPTATMLFPRNAYDR